MSGTIAVRPVHINNKSACRFCKYKALCRFDWQMNDYNILAPAGKAQVLGAIQAPAGD